MFLFCFLPLLEVDGGTSELGVNGTTTGSSSNKVGGGEKIVTKIIVFDIHCFCFASYLC